MRSKAPKKPDLLDAVDRTERMGLPLVAGGLMDQPHIWLLQAEMVNGVKSLFHELDKLAAAQPG